VCPTGALSAHSPTNVELLGRAKQAIQDTGAVAFACARYQEGTPVKSAVTLTCLGRLDESVLVGALSFGAREVLLLDGACEGCPQAGCRGVAEASVNRANRLLSAFGGSGYIALVPHPPQDFVAGLGEADAMSRRKFFSVLGRQTARVGAIAADSVLASHGMPAEKELKKGEMPVWVPEKRQLLQAALKRLATAPAAGSNAGGVWLKFRFTEACTGCQMCTFFCPSGALTKWEQDDRVGVGFQVSKCVACGLCRDSCYVKAVVLLDEVDLNYVLNETVEALPMRTAESAPWRTSGTERAARAIMDSLGLTNE
jgi:formate hydrogenlyase subunit 6/NADH:ubiquinone oxidoreductase subunit I